MYCYKTLKEYLNDLAAKLPAPGGGSAAALSASLGASLISMVVNFTLGKPKYAKYEKELKKALRDSEKLRNEFLGLVDLDVVAYKSKDIKKALGVPLKICRLSSEAIELCPLLIKKSNIFLISDLAAAAVLLESAFSASRFSVEINLKIAKDRKLSGAIRKELRQKEKIIKRIRLNTEEKVGAIIRG